MTTISNVECVQHLLQNAKFEFVLTRKFSSDPIESFFGWLRKSSGSNDQLDARATLAGIEKVLKTGIISASKESNAQCSTGHQTGALKRSGMVGKKSTSYFPEEAVVTLEQHLRSFRCSLPIPETAAIAMVGGYLARVVKEKVDCENCFLLTVKAASNAPCHGLIRHQDTGGLLYPPTELTWVLQGLKEYIDVLLKKRKFLENPLHDAVVHALPVLESYDFLKCTVPEHQNPLLELLCVKFFRPILTNYAATVTDMTLKSFLL